MRIALALLLSLSSAGQSLGSVQNVFEKNYFEHYREGYCKANSVEFLNRLKTDGYDLRDFFLVLIENKGISSFGLVNAEQARSGVRGRRLSEEKNWHEHYIILGKDGTVYDFDYTASPTTARFASYVENMFLNETECGDSATLEICAGRDDKLNDYRLKLYRADRLTNGNGPEAWTGSLRNSLEFNFSELTNE